MARSSRWNKELRSKLLKLVNRGVSEQDIRQQFTTTDPKGNTRDMNAVEFAQQLKKSMVEAGVIKQAPGQRKAPQAVSYTVTSTGRLTVSDFSKITGADAGDTFVLERPRGRSQAWRLVPFKE